MTDIGATRLYAASIAIVSGVYSVGSSWLDGVGMMAADWVMLTIGIVVLAHGVVLLTPAAMALGRFSGPLMVIWAVVMLANQGLAMGGMDVDPGMIAVAVLMLASGLIMIARPMGSEPGR